MENKKNWIESIYKLSDTINPVEFTQNDRQTLYGLYYTKKNSIGKSEILKMVATILILITLNLICIQKIKNSKNSDAAKGIYENYLNNQ